MAEMSDGELATIEQTAIANLERIGGGYDADAVRANEVILGHVGRALDRSVYGPKAGDPATDESGEAAGESEDSGDESGEE